MKKIMIAMSVMALLALGTTTVVKATVKYDTELTQNDTDDKKKKKKCTKKGKCSAEAKAECAEKKACDKKDNSQATAEGKKGSCCAKKKKDS